MGVARDDIEAMRWLRSAGDGANASAQYNLGFAYYSGRDVGKDDAKAVSWFRRTVEEMTRETR